MKKIITFIILLFLFCDLTKSQDYYTPFDFENGIWVNGYPYSNYFPDGTHDDGAGYQFFCKGDTLIDSIKYFKLYQFGIIKPIMGKFDTIPISYKCAIRNNDNKQILVKFPTDTLPKVLYDFNLKIGDTIHNGVYGYGANLIVKKIDSILICGKYHKKYTTDKHYSNNGDLASLIEGKGMDQYLFGDPSINCFEFCFRGCYTERGTSLCSNCYLLLDIKETKEVTDGIEIFPNPSNSKLIITSLIEIKKISIYNLFGQILYFNSFVNTRNANLNIKSLKNGIYIIKIELINNNIRTKSLIKE